MAGKGRAARGATPGAGGSGEPPLGPDGRPLTFEQALEKLEDIVDRLEEGSLSLEDSIARFEDGVHLTKFLEGELERAQKRVEELVERGGSVTTRPWAEDEDDADDDGDAGTENDDEDDAR